jgi:REP element-mobilizing transposase RayT
MPQKPKQQDFFPKKSKSYGGKLLNKYKNRLSGRPLSTSKSMHLILRSSKAIGDKSFKTTENSKEIKRLVDHFSKKNGIYIHSLANVGNHLHFHLKITNRTGYYRFIRALTAAIAMFVSGRNRWTATKDKQKFWDYRPFTRIVVGLKDFVGMQDYIQFNQLEGLGLARAHAKFLIQRTLRLSG